MALDERQLSLLAPYVSDVSANVYAVRDLKGITGAVMARYSRAETGLRETLVREFIQEDAVSLEKAHQLIERVLIAYGDDSVGELEGAHLCFEDISLLATKVIEHRRIGGSPIEQSTRYIRYDFRDEQGRFRYFRPQWQDTALAARYVGEMDALFEAYGRMWRPIQDLLMSWKPLAEASYDVTGRGPERRGQMREVQECAAFDRTYRMDIKTKTCDILRAFLPCATLANVGLFGNGRYYQHLISRLLSACLPEARQLGSKSLEALSQVIPHYVKRAQASGYWQENERAMRALAAEWFGDLPHESAAAIERIDPDGEFVIRQLDGRLDSATLQEALSAEAEIGQLTAMVFPYARAPFPLLRRRVQDLGPEKQRALRAAYIGTRQTRRDRPDRALEYGYPHQFELVTDWGVYKDLMRHRMGTILSQDWVPDLGFEMPDEIQEAGLKSEAEGVVQRAEALYHLLARQAPDCASYAFLQGHRARWFLAMNERALMHMLELRSAVQGHPRYRKASQIMHRLLAERFPERAAAMKFVNHDEIFWSRSQSEAAQRVREARLEP